MQRRLVEASNSHLPTSFESATDTSAARQQQGSLYRPRPLKNNITTRRLEADYRVKTGQNLQPPTAAHRRAAKIGSLRTTSLTTKLPS